MHRLAGRLQRPSPQRANALHLRPLATALALAASSALAAAALALAPTTHFTRVLGSVWISGRCMRLLHQPPPEWRRLLQKRMG